MKMKKLIPLFIILGLAFLAFGVYAVSHRLGMPTVVEKPAAFWMGLWQGLIVLLSFITSWFDHGITIYQAGNNGFWYNFGYLLGLTVALGGGAGAKASHSRMSKDKS